MKNFYSAVLIAMMPVAGMAQIGVGTTSLDATAMLQVNASASTNAKGFLGPRVALTSTSANSPFSVTPATGLMVYNTATAGSGVNEVTPGYYTYTGTGWERLAAPPTTFVGGTAGSFPIGGGEFLAPDGFLTYGYIGSISLPPGRWEVMADYTCVTTGNYQLGDIPITSWENTYWLSTSETHSTTGILYPLPLNTLPTGGPTTDAMFNGAAVSVQKVAQPEYDGFTLKSIHHFPRQSMKFYINNTGSTDKTYYLHFSESCMFQSIPSNNGQYFQYKATSGENRLFAIKIN